MLIFKISFEKKTHDDVEISRQLKTAKRNRTTEFVKKTVNDNCERQIRSRLKKKMTIRPFRVVTIVPLKLLQHESREPGRVLGRRVQPSEK